MAEYAGYPKKVYKPGGQIARVLSAEEHEQEYADWSEDPRVRLEPAPRRRGRPPANKVETEETEE